MAPPVKEVVLASLPLEEEGKGMAPLVNEAVLTASRLEVEGKGNYIELEKEKVEEGTSDLEDEIWHDKEPSKIWPDEEPIKLLKNKKGSLGLGANMTYGGEIRVVFETPSNFAIFRFDGVKLYRHRPDTIRAIQSHLYRGNQNLTNRTIDARARGLTARPLRQRHGTRPPIERHPHHVELLGEDHSGRHRLPQVHVPRPLSSFFRHFQEPPSWQLVHHPGEFVSGLYL